jgi:nucleoside-diphosphate-sugar epimerase
VKIFVTGASGFIGGAIARRLAQDHEVVALSRSQASDAAIAALGAEPLRGDLESLEPGGIPVCDAVVHCAAYVNSWGSRADFVRGNVEGTDRVLAAARAAGARRFVHMSTEAVLWRGQPLLDVDESHPYPERTPFLYSETKAEAERRVRAAADTDFCTVALRPRFVWGPGDRTIVPEARRMIERGAFVWIDGGRARTSTTHVDNLVFATERALTHGRGGEAYFVTDGEVHDFRSFLTKLLEAHGVTPPDRSVPGWLVRPLAAGVEGVWRALGIRSEPPLTHHAVALLSCDCTLRDDRARAKLGYAPRISVEEGLAALRRQGRDGAGGDGAGGDGAGNGAGRGPG